MDAVTEDRGIASVPTREELLEARRQLIESVKVMDSPEAAGLALREADRLGEALNRLY